MKGHLLPVFQTGTTFLFLAIAELGMVSAIGFLPKLAELAEHTLFNLLSFAYEPPSTAFTTAACSTASLPAFLEALLPFWLGSYNGHSTINLRKGGFMVNFCGRERTRASAMHPGHTKLAQPSAIGKDSLPDGVRIDAGTPLRRALLAAA